MNWETFIEIKRLLADHPLFLLGLLLLLGYGVGKLAMRVRLPEITGFILAGLLVSPYTTGIVSYEINDLLHVLTEVAIGFLALTIGAEFSWKKLKRIGPDVAVITAITVVGTFLIVMFGCWGLNRLVPAVNIGHPYAILLAIIACATAPAIIVAEIHHMRAHGRFVDYLFGVVAMTDAITVAIFGLAFTVVVNMLGDVGSYSLIGQSVREIIMSVAVGGISAFPLIFILQRIPHRNELLIITIGYVFVMTGFALALHLSPLLTNMALGATLVQFPADRHRAFRALESFTPPIYALFFVIAGLEIDPRVFTNPATLTAGGGYILLRGLARYGTTWWGARIRGLSIPIRRNLGWCTFSQGGIALGFVLLIQTAPGLETLRATPGYVNLTVMVNIVLMSIFVNELISPILLRRGVTRGNEMES